MGKPENFINKNDMINILIDLHIAEAKVSVINLQMEEARKNYAIERKIIFKKYKTSQMAFDSSFKYYSLNVKELDLIYTNVIDSLNLMQSLNKINR